MWVDYVGSIAPMYVDRAIMSWVAGLDPAAQFFGRAISIPEDAADRMGPDGFLRMTIVCHCPMCTRMLPGMMSWSPRCEAYLAVLATDEEGLLSGQGQGFLALAGQSAPGAAEAARLVEGPAEAERPGQPCLPRLPAGRRGRTHARAACRGRGRCLGRQRRPRSS